MADFLVTTDALRRAGVVPAGERTWMMVDLADSTGAIVGSPSLESVPVRKMILHNCIAASWVCSCKGRVVKFLGDGLLAEWEGDPKAGAANAKKAAQGIMSALMAFNADHPGQEIRSKIGLHRGCCFTCTYAMALSALRASPPAQQYLAPGAGEAGFSLSVLDDDPHGLSVAVVARLVSWAKAGQILASGEFRRALGDGNTDVSKCTRVPLRGIGSCEVAEVMVAGEGIGVRTRVYDTTAQLGEVLVKTKTIFDMALSFSSWDESPGSHARHLIDELDGGKVPYQGDVRDRTACAQIRLRLADWQSKNYSQKINEFAATVESIVRQPIPAAAKDGLTRFVGECWGNIKSAWEGTGVGQSDLWSFLSPGIARITPTTRQRAALESLENLCTAAHNDASAVMECCDLTMKALIQEVEKY